MSASAAFVFAVLAVTVGLFVLDRVRVDLVALGALLALTFGGAITLPEALAGFASPVVIVLAALFVVGEGLAETGVAARVARGPAALIGRSEARALALLMALAAVLSALMSSTGAVAVMIPVVLSVARGAGLRAARLLLPMAFAAQLGGLLTLIGTPPNLVASAALADATGEGLAFFAITPVGLAALVLAVGLTVAFGRWFLPKGAGPDDSGDRPSVGQLGADFGLADSLQSTEVGSGSPLAGRTLAEMDVRRTHRVNVVQLERRGQLVEPGPDTRLEAGDLLTVQGSPDAVAAFEAALRMTPHDEREGRVDSQLDRHLGLVEVILMPRSKLLGRSVSGVRFRDRYGVTAVAIKRGGEVLHERVSQATLRFGDTLLLAGPWPRLEALSAERRDFLIATETEEARSGAFRAGRAPLAVAIVLAMLLAMTLGWAPVAVVSLAAAWAMALGGCVRPSAIYRSINGPSVVLVAAMLPVATALEHSGGLTLIVDALSAATAQQPPHVALLLVMVATSVLSQVISNTATTVLMAPVGVEMAAGLGISPTPLLLGLAVAASSAFTTPVASPVNTLVLGPGGYRFVDYVRAGVPLQLLVVAVGWLLVPWLAPF